MLSRTVLFSILLAFAEARFGQEQIPIQAIASAQGGQPGEAATLAGQTVGLLLAAANPCAKLSQADKIVAALGTGADVIAAAKGLVAAEQNFNPFAVSIPSICNDPSLPATAELRGIVPLVDPAVGGSDVENANSQKSLTTPFANAGMSVADIMAANGFSNFTTKAADGTVGAAPAGNGGAAAPAAPPAAESSAAAPAAPAATPSPAASADAAAGGCPTTLVTVTRQASAAAPAASSAAPVESSAAPAASPAAPAASPAASSSAGGGVDFGLCTPTILRAGGLGGRPATEFTFQATDPLISKGQQEALNPNIITNRICDQLTNVCQSNDAAKALCLQAKAQILASGKRDDSVVTDWNSALGF